MFPRKPSLASCRMEICPGGPGVKLSGSPGQKGKIHHGGRKGYKAAWGGQQATSMASSDGDRGSLEHFRLGTENLALP